MFKPIHYLTYAAFQTALNNDSVPSDALVFIKDKKLLYTHGTYYYCNFSAEDVTSLNNLVDAVSEHIEDTDIHTTIQKKVSIPFGTTESTSTSTAFTAIVEEFADVTELKTGMAVFLKNTKVTSATGWTLNIKRSASDTTGLGAKSVYVTTAAETRSTTQFALNYKYLFVYDESLNSNSGGWYICQLFDTNSTYSSMSVAEGATGTETAERLMRADYLKQIIAAHAPQSDWNATSGNAVILNKPSIPSDSNLVHKTGDETIGGDKTFTGIINATDINGDLYGGVYASHAELEEGVIIPPVNGNSGTLTLGSLYEGDAQLIVGNSNGNPDGQTLEEQATGGWTQIYNEAIDKTLQDELNERNNVQSDWNQTTTTADDYIKNKPSIVTSVNGNTGAVTLTLGETNMINTVKVNGSALTPDGNKAIDVKTSYTLVNQGTSTGTSSVPISITPNTFNVWGEISSLYITLGGTLDSTVMNEYLMQFSTASSASSPTISIDGAVEWAGIDTFQGGKTYQISVINGYAIGVEFDTISQS